MKIALMHGSTLASKNEVIYKALVKAVENKGHEIINFGVKINEDPPLIPIQKLPY